MPEHSGVGEVLDDGTIDALAERIAARIAPPDDRPLLSVKQLAERLSVSERTARDLVDRKVIPSMLVGDRSRRIAPADVEAYLRERQGHDE